MDIFVICQKADIILAPLVGILTVVNSMILVFGFVMDKFLKDDKFVVKFLSDRNITFYNKGKYPVFITEIALWVDDGAETAPKLENLHSEEIKIIGRDKKCISIPLNINEIKKLSKKYKILYLCFDIKSESGIIYEQLAHRLTEKIIKNKCRIRLKKELPFFA